MKFKVSEATSLKALVFCVSANIVGTEWFSCQIAPTLCFLLHLIISHMNTLGLSYIMYEEYVNGKDMKQEGRESLKSSSLIYGEVRMLFLRSLTHFPIFVNLCTIKFPILTEYSTKR